MAIKFHCDHCGKKIEAPDTAGGKWGKCPACHNKVYVPQSQSADDPLTLAPVDETEEQKRQQLMRESFQITQDILQEKNIPEAGAAAAPASDVREETLTNYIIQYLRQMADGNLDEAQRTADLIVPHRPKAIPILDHIAKDKTPYPELKDVPQQVLSGLIRNLKTRIS